MQLTQDSHFPRHKEKHMLTDLRKQTSPYIFCESFSYTGLRECKRDRIAYIFCLTQTCYIGEHKRHRIFFVKQVLDGLVDDANVTVLYL